MSDLLSTCQEAEIGKDSLGPEQLRSQSADIRIDRPSQNRTSRTLRELRTIYRANRIKSTKRHKRYFDVKLSLPGKNRPSGRIAN
jgi:hypothetical protein